MNDILENFSLWTNLGIKGCFSATSMFPYYYYDKYINLLFNLTNKNIMFMFWSYSLDEIYNFMNK